jgi:hypothetical protein
MENHSRWATLAEVWSHAKAYRVLAGLFFLYAALSAARDEWPDWFETKIPLVATPVAWVLDRFPPWLLLAAGLVFALYVTFDWAHRTVGALRIRQPRIAFERDWYRETTVRRQVGVNMWQSAGLGRFQGVRLTNQSRPGERAQTARKVHARVWFYDAAGEVSMELSTARWTKNPEGYQAPESAIEAIDMIPGSPCDLDLLVRINDDSTAQGWTNTGAAQSGTLPPGDYHASVHLNSDDFIDEQIYEFAVSVPSDATERITISLRSSPNTSVRLS